MRAVRTDGKLDLKQQLVGRRRIGVVGSPVLAPDLAELARPERQRQRTTLIAKIGSVRPVRAIDARAGVPPPRKLIIARHVEPRGVLPAVELLAPYYEQLGVAPPDYRETFDTPRFDEQVEAVLESRPPAFSFVYGVPEARILERCRSLGIRTIGTATNVDEAMALDEAGVDVIVASERSQTLDSEVFLLHGIDVTRYRIVALKSQQHFRGGFSSIAGTIIRADTPGFTTSDLSLLPFQRITRPIWPLDPLPE